MRHYVFLPNSDQFNAIGLEPADRNIIEVRNLDTSTLGTWTPVIVHGFEDNPGEEGDFPSLTDYNQLPVASQRAWDVLRTLIGYCSEALPIIHPTGKSFYIIHVMETIDCLDCAKSEFSRNKTTGRVNRVFRYAFKEELLTGKHIFKLPRESGAELIVDDAFREAVEVNALKGLMFNHLPMVTENAT